jgi:LysM repeat protein
MSINNNKTEENIGISQIINVNDTASLKAEAVSLKAKTDAINIETAALKDEIAAVKDETSRLLAFITRVAQRTSEAEE